MAAIEQKTKWRAALLLRLRPQGISSSEYQDALAELEIAERVYGILPAEGPAWPTPHSPRAPQPQPEAPENTPAVPIAPTAPRPMDLRPAKPAKVPKGARLVVEYLKRHPGSTAEQIGKATKYTRPFVRQCLATAQRMGILILKTVDRPTGTAHYRLGDRPMAIAPEPEAAEPAHH